MRWLEAFDRIDLSEMRREVAMPAAVQPARVIADEERHKAG